MSETRDISMITGQPVDNVEPAAQPPLEEGSENPSRKGSLARAFSPYPFPLTNEEPFSSETATPIPDQAPPSKPKQPKPDPEPRADVEALCNRLVDLMVARGCRQPTIGAGWRDAARLLLDRDGVDFQFAMDVLVWSQGSKFWRKNILSMPKFREKWDQLWQDAEAQHGPHPNNRASTTPPTTADETPSYGSSNVIPIQRQRPSTTDTRVAGARAAAADLAARIRAQNARAQGAGA